MYLPGAMITAQCEEVGLYTRTTALASAPLTGFLNEGELALIIALEPEPITSTMLLVLNARMELGWVFEFNVRKLT